MTLAGRRILVTRRPEQAGTLKQRLAELGAEVLEVAAIGTAPPENTGAMDAALRGLSGYDWVVFTSANAVQAVAERLAVLGLDWPSVRPFVGSVGPSTSEVIRARLAGAEVSLEPGEDFRAEGLLAAFAARPLQGARVLLPASDRARDVLPRGLRERGAAVDLVVAYRTVTPEGMRERLAETLGRGVDIAVFASPSAVENFVLAAGELAHGLPAAVIGPVTEQAARAAGLDVRVVARPSTAEGLVAGLVRALERFDRPA